MEENTNGNGMNDTSKVVDVLDVSYPLLAGFKESCPGTCSHGKNVSILLEPLGSELGLNVHYLRIAGQYHDIGKRVFPKYFSENIGEDDANPHDELAPHLSHKIITSHVGETVQILLNDPNIPVEVVRWCAQHHGTSVLSFFYRKSESKNEDRYRYPTTAPTSLESGLLMMCDVMEAKCRSLYQNDKLHDIEKEVNSTIDNLLATRQLDDISLPKVSFLRVIKEILCKELSAMYKAKRIDYDEADGANGVKSKKTEQEE